MNCSVYLRGEEGKLLLHDCQSTVGASGAPLYRFVKERNELQIFAVNVADPAGENYFSSIELPKKATDGTVTKPGNANIALSTRGFSGTESSELLSFRLPEPESEVFPSKVIEDSRMTLNAPANSAASEIGDMQGERGREEGLKAVPAFEERVNRFSRILGSQLGVTTQVVYIANNDFPGSPVQAYGLLVEAVNPPAGMTPTGLMPGDLIVQFDTHWLDAGNIDLERFVQRVESGEGDLVSHKVLFQRTLTGASGPWETAAIRAQMFGETYSFMIGAQANGATK